MLAQADLTADPGQLDEPDDVGLVEVERVGDATHLAYGDAARAHRDTGLLRPQVGQRGESAQQRRRGAGRLRVDHGLGQRWRVG
ncbi:MAG: hypothetical protein BGO96_00075 [Micrococcales bacterium 73-15]|nr:MAG: hypothetical protein BGO96_00075 [Micrococcales bacterium 73-15]